MCVGAEPKDGFGFGFQRGILEREREKKPNTPTNDSSHSQEPGIIKS